MYQHDKKKQQRCRILDRRDRNKHINSIMTQSIKRETVTASNPSALARNTPTIRLPSGGLTTMRSSGRAHFAVVVVMVRDPRVKEE
jgi:hypothetical protein